MILRLSSQAPVSFLVSCYRTRAKGRGRPLVGACSPRYYGPYDPTTATSMKTSLKNTLRILSLFVCDYPKGPTYLKEGILGGSWREETAPGVQTGMVEFIALPFPFPSKLKIWSFHVVVVQGRPRNVQKNVVVLTFPLSWPSWFRKVPISP